MPKISVIVPIYNVEKYLRECLDSIINQTFEDLEIILLDDGGQDSCPQIIDEYAASDKRIVAIHKENGGYGHTMNVGLSRATGKYIGIVEPDDYINPKMYEDLYKIADKFDSDIVKSGFYNNYQTKQLTGIVKDVWSPEIPENQSFTIKEYPYFLSYHPSIWSCIYKREFLNKNNIRFVEAPGAGWTDNPFQVQTMCLAERINYTSKAYYYWRRLNEDPSEDLKDITIPIKRGNEVHTWLETNNINDKELLNSLALRELFYIEMVFKKKNLKENDINFTDIDEFLKRLNLEDIKTSKFLSAKRRKRMIMLLNSPLKCYKYFKGREFRKKIFNTLFCKIKNLLGGKNEPKLL